jgi:peptidoglycan hydrolase CwlO-like protein
MQKITLLTILFFTGLMLSTGCTKKPSQEELGKLSEARMAVEAAEKKLAELKAERTQLETELEAKKEELKKAEEQRDAVKAKLGN